MFQISQETWLCTCSLLKGDILCSLINLDQEYSTLSQDLQLMMWLILVFTGLNGLQYLQEFVPTEEKTTAMVAEEKTTAMVADRCSLL